MNFFAGVNSIDGSVKILLVQRRSPVSKYAKDILRRKMKCDSIGFEETRSISSIPLATEPGVAEKIFIA